MPRSRAVVAATNFRSAIAERTSGKSCAPSRMRSAPEAKVTDFGFGQRLARIDQAQPRQPEIAHGARRRADVLAELRLDQNDHRPAFRPWLGAVGTRTWHCACFSYQSPRV